MGGTFQRGEPRQVMIPIALASAVGEGDLTAVVAGLAVGAGAFTWDTDLATTRKAFCVAFAGRSAQTKDANAYVFGNGETYKLFVRVDTSGVIRYACAAGTYALFDLVGPKKQSGNLLEPQTVEVVTDPAQAVGRVVGLAGVNPGYVEVELLSKKAGAALDDGSIQVWSFPVELAALANGDYLTDYTPGFAGEILSVDFRVGKPATTAAKAATLNLEINATDVTGGVVALTSANATPAGHAVAGTAVTANNVFDADDTISIEASSVTAFVEGNGVLLVKVRNRG